MTIRRHIRHTFERSLVVCAFVLWVTSCDASANKGNNAGASPTDVTDSGETYYQVVHGSEYACVGVIGETVRAFSIAKSVGNCASGSGDPEATDQFEFVLPTERSQNVAVAINPAPELSFLLALAPAGVSVTAEYPPNVKPVDRFELQTQSDVIDVFAVVAGKCEDDCSVLLFFGREAVEWPLYPDEAGYVEGFSAVGTGPSGSTSPATLTPATG